MQVQPYLFFDGRCEEAVEFYRNALGAEVTMLMRFKDAPPEPPEPAESRMKSDESCVPPPRYANKVMHASLRIGA
ncbi:MAG: VOC family protein, partial [Nitrosospira sp.]|nr:VOC family protein [Nitrosospira sp.]